MTPTDALRQIAEQDVSEIALDPDWPRRMARAALAAAEKDESELVAALRVALPRLESCSATYNASNFTDRRREGPLLKEAAETVRAALAKHAKE